MIWTRKHSENTKMNQLTKLTVLHFVKWENFWTNALTSCHDHYFLMKECALCPGIFQVAIQNEATAAWAWPWRSTPQCPESRLRLREKGPSLHVLNVSVFSGLAQMSFTVRSVCKEEKYSMR